ncbi:hypothetical protein BJY00DRAFT_216953 [Aspergillus carlsbadensis]|nr:hypothetical protein BJY00DRAFT_216953 [Aspergillus carlsbadensis]
MGVCSCNGLLDTYLYIKQTQCTKYTNTSLRAPLGSLPYHPDCLQEDPPAPLPPRQKDRHISLLDPHLTPSQVLVRARHLLYKTLGKCHSPPVSEMLPVYLEP